MLNQMADILKEKYPKYYITEIFDDGLILKPEQDDGHIEYKRTLADCTETKSVKYATQMRWRILENVKNQTANYYIGVDDDGTIIGLTNEDLLESVRRFVSIADSIEASISGIKIIHITDKIIIHISVKNKRLKDNYLVDFD